jgi:protocatechuate 3,4-dioxygenase alpha subunit
VRPAPGQTVGPFFHLGLAYPGSAELVPPAHPRAVRLHGRVLDGAGAPVPDALLEIRQADPQGRIPRTTGSLRRDGWTFTGWGRAATDPTGRYTFSTLEPGRTDPDRAPFFAVTVFARGLLDALFTRAYLPDDPDLLARDPLLAGLPERGRATLVAARDDTGLVFDVHLQGAQETVFLTFPRHRDEERA